MEQLLFLAIIAAASLGFGLAFKRRLTSAELKGRDGERRVAKVIASLGFPALHDVYLPSTNGMTQIDHIVRVGNALVVIETKNLAGMVYGSAKDRHWRQSFKRSDSRSFLNPLIQNSIHEKSVRSLVGNQIDVRPLVVMAGAAKFPKGFPEGVVRIKDLKTYLRHTFVNAGKVVSGPEAWERLVAEAKANDTRKARQAHAKTVGNARSRSDKGSINLQ